MEIITRKEAKEKGLKTYFTGIQCKNGHLCCRFVSNCSCSDCNSEYYWANVDKIREQHKQYFTRYVSVPENKEKMLATTKEWYVLNYEHVKETQDKYLANRTPEKVESDLKAKSHRQALRRAQKKNATPKWVDSREVRKIFSERPKGMVVDHDIPLQSALVCGLHVPENLRYLTVRDNQVKKNKFIPFTEKDEIKTFLPKELWYNESH